MNAEMNQFIVPFAQNDPRLFTNASQAHILVDLGKRLLDAAKNGDVEEVKNLINNGAPFTTDWLGFSPLHFSAMNGHLTTCEALLKAGICRDARTKVDRTPLHLAAQEGHADIVDLLLKGGADLEARDTLRMTSLHWAAERGHTPVVQVLMRYGANIRLRNKFEMTPLEIAEAKGHIDVEDAMLNTQLDTLSSVGRMAARSQDLADANAFILTDEETLIPAAPPADEVTVTADHVGYKKTMMLTDWMNVKPELPTNGITVKVEPFFNENQPQIDAISLGLTNGDETTGDGNANDNMMLVETPDGRLLYVREEMDNAVNGPKLAIFTEDGDPIDDENLLAQVVSAIANFPTTGVTDDSDVLTLGNGFISEMDEEEKVAVVVAGLDFPLLEGTETVINDVCQTKTSLLEPAVVGVGDLMVAMPTDVQGANRKALISQLVQFATDVERTGSTLCVDGVNDFRTKNEIIKWFSAHGLLVTEFTSISNFTVSLVNNEREYLLTASYDPEYGSITFSNRSLSGT